jgi:malate dehydrogenase
MKKSSAASAANAACDHMHDWWVGTKPGEFVNMGVISDGNQYGIAEGLIFSFPVAVRDDGEWGVFSSLKNSEFTKKKLRETEKELLEERKLALNI